VKRSAALIAVAAAVLLAAPAGAAPDRASGGKSGVLIPPRLYRNCTNFNQRYPHGVGRRYARDKTSGRPVTNFLRSTIIYRRAMRYNDDLDRDGDGIACEKR
jgi:Excalibur calcium-binding domain